MAQELTDKTNALLQKVEKRPNLILEIEGIPFIFGTSQVKSLPKYGDDIVYGQDGLLYGRPLGAENSLGIIDLQKTTRSITQQIRQDKASASSISTFTVSMLDINGFLTKLFQPNNVVPDMLSRRCKLGIVLEGGSYPNDLLDIYQGVITDINFTSGGICELVVNHPDALKEADIYIQYKSKLTSPISDSDLTIDVETTKEFIGAQDILESFVQIGEELIKIDSFTDTQFTASARAQENTIASAHNSGADIVSFYKLTGTSLEIALKVMLSDTENEFYSSIEVQEIGGDGIEVNPNRLYFLNTNLEKEINLTVGDTVSVSGYLTDEPITGFGQSDAGSFVEFAASVAFVSSPNLNAEFKSQYNTLPEGAGLGMLPSEVDIARHLRFLNLFPTSFLPQSPYIKDTINGKDFIHKTLYFPNSCYAIPRLGKASVALTLPPLVDFETVTLDERNIVNVNQLNIKRSINKNFYNSVVYAYDQDSITDEFQEGQIFVSALSQQRIKTKTKPLNIEGAGLRAGNGQEIVLEKQSLKLLDRFSLGAESVSGVRILYGTGFNLDVGDVVIFGSENLNLSDSDTGTKRFTPRLYEIVNKKFSIDGRITVDLLNTNFSSRGRFGVISPSSIIDNLSGTRLRLKQSYSTPDGQDEAVFKWQRYEGKELLIHTNDYSYQEKVTIVQVDPVNENTIILDREPVGVLEDMVLDIPQYEVAGSNDFYKNIHVYNAPRLFVVGTGTTTSFNVDDASKLFVGSVVRVHSLDYSTDSIESIVTDITGSTITVGTSLEIAPLDGFEVDLIGFVKDNGVPYRYI